jgi:hypothetical protein
MTDVTIELPVRLGAEAAAFAMYLSSFMRSRSAEAEMQAANSDAPYLILRSDPLLDRELKVLIFQSASIAQAFAHGWSRVCGGVREAAQAA